MSTELIVAIDVPSSSELPPILESLPNAVTHFKVGLELFTAEGPKVISVFNDKNKSVFLDLKLHDIPRTVARAVTSAAQHSVKLLTVHAGGGRAMLEAAAQAAKECGDAAPKLVAVTTLTSLDQNDLRELGVTRELKSHTIALADLAIDCGIDGLVCSPLEAKAMRERLGDDILLVTPGIRPTGTDVGDQKRVATPTSAARDGASHIVVGRPILEASDPASAAQAILDELTAATRS